jgi:hypothetical protein
MNSLRPIRNEMLSRIDQVKHLRLLYPQSWKPVLNPHAQAANRVATEFFQKAGIVTDENTLRMLQEERADLYSGYPYPTANFEQLVTLTEFLALWIIFDDLVTENSGNYWRKYNLSVEDYVLALRTGELSPNADPFLRAWWNICRRFSNMSQRWRDRLADRFGDWIRGALEEKELVRLMNEPGQMVPLQKYLDTRTYSVGAMPTFYFIEYVEGFELPEEVRQNDVMRALHTLGSQILLLGNDVISLEKDIESGWINPVVLEQKNRRLSLIEAVESVVNLHNQTVFDFLALEKKLPSFGPEVDPFVRLYVHLMHFVIRGLAEWQMGAERYHWKRGLAPGRSPVRVSMASFADE